MNEYIVRETGFPGAVKQEVVGELVRCKDCKHRGKELCLMYYVDEGGFGYDLTRDSDYCVFGERKDDD